MNATFTDVLGRYVQRSLYSHGQLATLSGVPKNTITNWLGGRVKRPHRWQPLLQLAAALDLSAAETDALLQAAHHPPLADLRHTAAAADRPLFEPWQARQPAPFQAIADLPTFVGRTAELNELRRLLLTERHLAIVSLFGMGGVGKTSLAAHVAYELRHEFPDGVLWARLDSSDPMVILNMLAGVYGVDVSQYSTLDSRAAAVRGLLAHKRALLILDNADSSDQLLPLLPPTTGACAVLVTTRHDLAALDGWPQLTLEPFSADSGEALALFAQFLGQTAVAQQRTLLQQIADRVGHLPLALSLLAARLRRTPTPGAMRQLADQLGSTPLDQLRRENRSVRVTFDLSYGQLAPAEQQFFARLGALGRDDFTAAAAAAVARVDLATARDRLDNLQQLSLLQASQNGRFRLHPLLHDFAREHLAAQPDAVTAHQQMIRFYIQQVAVQQQNDSGERAVSPVEVAHDISHLHAALEAAHRHQQPELLQQAVRTFFLPLHEQGVWERLDEAIGWVMTTAEETADFDAWAEMLTLRSKLLWWRDQDGTATAQQAVALAQRAENPHLIADALRELGAWLSRNNRFAEAVQVTKDGLALAEQVGDQTKVVAILNNLGHALLHLGAWQEAREALTRGYTLARAIDYYRAFVVLAGNLGCLYAQQGEWATAVSIFDSGAAVGRDHNCLTALMGLLGDWGYEALFVDDLQTARDTLSESLALARQNSHTVSVAVRLSDLGEISRREGHLADAARQHRDAVRLAEQHRLHSWLPILQFRQALLLQEMGERETAVALTRTALQSRHLVHRAYDREIALLEQQLQALG